MFDLVADEDTSRDRDRREGVLILVRELRLELEDERSAGEEGTGVVVPLEPFLGKEDADIGSRGEFDDMVNLIDDGKGVLKVGKSTTIEESRDDFNDLLSVADDISFDFNSLPTVAVGNRGNACLGMAHIANLEGRSTLHHAEAVGEVDKFEEIAVDTLGEDGADNGLGNNALEYNLSAARV